LRRFRSPRGRTAEEACTGYLTHPLAPVGGPCKDVTAARADEPRRVGRRRATGCPALFRRPPAERCVQVSQHSALQWSHSRTGRPAASRTPSRSPAGHLVPFALCAAFPHPSVGRDADDYYGTSVAVGLAPRRPSRLPSVVDVRARRRWLIRPLAWSRSPPPTRRRVRASATLTRYPGGPAPGAVAGDVDVHRWGLSFKQSGLHHIARVLPDSTISVFWRSLLSHHAVVPVGFCRKVGWVTQKPCSSELLPSARGIRYWVKRRT
jgi:hypothetical protein